MVFFWSQVRFNSDSLAFRIFFLHKAKLVIFRTSVKINYWQPLCLAEHCLYLSIMSKLYPTKSSDVVPMNIGNASHDCVILLGRCVVITCGVVQDANSIIRQIASSMFLSIDFPPASFKTR